MLQVLHTIIVPRNNTMQGRYFFLSYTIFNLNFIRVTTVHACYRYVDENSMLRRQGCISLYSKTIILTILKWNDLPLDADGSM